MIPHGERMDNARLCRLIVKADELNVKVANAMVKYAECGESVHFAKALRLARKLVKVRREAAEECASIAPVAILGMGHSDDE